MSKMLMIGLIGGMSWESSAQYYRIINKEVRARLGEDKHRLRYLQSTCDPEGSPDVGESGYRVCRLQHRSLPFS